MPKLKNQITNVHIETIMLLARGYTHREIAAKQKVSAKAISERVARIKSVLNCETVIQVVYTLAKSGTI